VDRTSRENGTADLSGDGHRQGQLLLPERNVALSPWRNAVCENKGVGGEKSKMKCPVCKKEIDRIIAVKMVSQEYYLEGNKYSETGKEWHMQTIARNCPECKVDISRFVEKG